MSAFKTVLLVLFISLLIIPVFAIFTGSLVTPDLYLSIFHYITLFVFWLLFITHIYVFVQVFERNIKTNDSSFPTEYASNRVYRIYIWLFIFGFTAFLVNISRIIRGGISIRSGGRVYEETFGQNTIINYDNKTIDFEK